jgi:hypothetical protein
MQYAHNLQRLSLNQNDTLFTFYMHWPGAQQPMTFRYYAGGPYTLNQALQRTPTHEYV